MKRLNAFLFALAMLASPLAASAQGVKIPLAYGAGSLWKGDHNGDGKVDVYTVYRGNIYVNLNGPGCPRSNWRKIKSSEGISNLRVVNWGGDKKSELLGITNAAWYVSSDGVTPWIRINTAVVPSYFSRVGDFDGNGIDDLFYSYRGNWYVAFNGASRIEKVNSSGVSSSELMVGDFDGDGKDDIFRAAKGKWRVSYGARSGWVHINNSGIPASKLRLGDFDGDGISDVLTTSSGHLRISYRGRGRWQPVVNANQVNPSEKNILVGNFLSKRQSSIMVSHGGVLKVHWGRHWFDFNPVEGGPCELTTYPYQ